MIDLTNQPRASSAPAALAGHTLNIDRCDVSATPRGHLLGKLFSIFAAVALAFSLPQEASAWGSGGFLKIGKTHTNRFILCNLTSPADGGDATLDTHVDDATQQATATLTSSRPSTACALYSNDNPDVPLGDGPANFGLSLTYIFSANGGGSGDTNKGHGNDCAKVDLDNPNSDKKNSRTTYCGGQSSVTCNNVGDGSERTYSAFCEQSTDVWGTLTWVPTSDYPNLPDWVKGDCGSGVDTSDPNHSNCVYQFGRGFELNPPPAWVLDDRGNVDLAACATIFPETTTTDGTLVARGEVLHFTEAYENSNCPEGDGYVDPLAAFYRNCGKDSFDPNTGNTPCQPEELDGVVYYHSGTGEITQEIELDVGQWDPNPTIQLKCDGGTDSGVIPTELLDSPRFSTERVTLEPDTTPLVSVDGDYDAGQSPLDKYGVLTDAVGAQIGLKLDFLSCRADGMSGIAQIVCKHLGGPTPDGKATVTLRISGNTDSGSGFTGISMPVNFNGTSSCPVVP